MAEPRLYILVVVALSHLMLGKLQWPCTVLLFSPVTWFYVPLPSFILISKQFFCPDRNSEWTSLLFWFLTIHFETRPSSNSPMLLQHELQGLAPHCPGFTMFTSFSQLFSLPAVCSFVCETRFPLLSPCFLPALDGFSLALNKSKMLLLKVVFFLTTQSHFLLFSPCSLPSQAT